MKKYLIFFLLFGFVLVGCKKNDDPVVVEEEQKEEEQQEEQQQEDSEKPEDYPVQNFMWQTMNAYYLWQGEIANLSDTKFADSDEGLKAYVAFLASESDPGNFFEKELLSSEDRFSFYSENYKDVTNLLAGVSKSNGVEFGLSTYGDGNDVLGFVNYIVKDSDAASKDIKRGDIFVGVNGTSLDLNNYTDLLFGDEDTYTLNMADVEDNVLTPNGKEVTLTKVEGLVEDPILTTNIVEMGDKKIAYLMYNQFVRGSGEQLNEVFAEFKASNVTDLVLDMRYNLGGNGFTAAILSSLIYDADPNKIFYIDRYNDKLQAQLDPESYENYFLNTTGTLYGNTDAPLNNLNLTKVYVLATGSSASASELVMVALDPYIEVIHIGSKTVGKNQGSNTFVDDPENGNFYNPDREDQINPDNQWAIQPIIVTAENSAGFSDYSAGLFPDFPLEEDITNLGTLGNPEEPLFAMAIEQITGVSSKRGFEVQMPVDLVTHSKMFTPLWDHFAVSQTPLLPRGKFRNGLEK